MNGQVTITVSMDDAIEFCILALQRGNKAKAIDILTQISKRNPYASFDIFYKYPTFIDKKYDFKY